MLLFSPGNMGKIWLHYIQTLGKYEFVIGYLILIYFITSNTLLENVLGLLCL